MQKALEITIRIQALGKIQGQQLKLQDEINQNQILLGLEKIMSNLLEILLQEKIETRILDDKYLISNFIKSTEKKSVHFY